MLILIAEFCGIAAFILTLGAILNRIAPLPYRIRVADLINDPRWDLSVLTSGFVHNTFHRVFGTEILSKSFLIRSLAFSLTGLVIFSLLFFWLNNERLCKYPIDWCESPSTNVVRLAFFVLVGMIAVDLCSFAQTSLFIRYVQGSRSLSELLFIGFADLVLSISIFCFVLPAALTINHMVRPVAELKRQILFEVRFDEDVKPPENASPGVAEQHRASQNFADSSGAQLREFAVWRSEGSDGVAFGNIDTAVVRGTQADIETLFQRALAHQGRQSKIVEKVWRYRSNEIAKNVRAVETTIDYQMAIVPLYSALYQLVLTINHSFWGFLRGDPLFVDLNRTALLAVAVSVQPGQTHASAGQSSLLQTI